VDVDGYLTRLGLTRPRRPDLAALRDLHAAHVDRVPYETFDLYLRRPWVRERRGLDPAAAVTRIVAGRGGFCYHLNGAFSLLLAELGFAVTWHLAGVQVSGRPAPGPDGNHLGLTVAGLSTRDCPEGTWLVDVGLGDALREPIPLRPGRYRQGPFRYEVGAVEGGWRFEHDPRGSFLGVDFASGPATAREFEPMHAFLSTSPESPFVRLAVAQRRDRGGIHVLRGCVLRRADRRGTRVTTVDGRDEWFAMLARVFGLTFAEYDGATRADLWRRVRDQQATRVAGLTWPGPG
jgi:N-hydroxyarylamine O-acetyltransferase